MNIFEDLVEELKEENLLAETVIETAKADNTVKTELTSIGQDTETPAVIAEEQASVDKTNLLLQRATDEIAFLQILEHVFAGVEREQLKIVPKPYDGLKVKKILHNVSHFPPDVDAAERSKAEFQLLQETESWHWSLKQRDERLTAAHLRRYCETSRPPLSSPALVALARFYRNSPYSEAVRNKFDLVITRLFSKANGKDQRETVFSREELITHLTELYAEWSSVPLYSIDTNDAEILEFARKFQSYIEYADNAVDFDDLIKSDFFTRLHLFKKGMNENFYAPLITAIGIESNIRIGNRYVELLEAEKQKEKTPSLENRYGIRHDNAISEATAKTYTIIELLNQRKPAEDKIEREYEPSKEKVKTPAKEKPAKAIVASQPNKWLIASTVLAVLMTIGIYFGTKPGSIETRNAAGKPGSPALQSYLQEARTENRTLIATVTPAWNQLTEEKRKDALKQMLSFGSEKGYEKVQLESKEGKKIGSAGGGSILLLD